MTTYLVDHATFNSKQELNYHVSMHEKHNADSLNATDRSIFRFIARYSVKYAGASHLKVDTIAAGVHKSARTVGRTLNRLEDCETIQRINKTRPKSGGKSASIIIIQPFMSERLTDSEVDEKASDSKDKGTNNETEPLRKQFKNHYVLETEIGAISVRNNIPAALYDILAPFFYGKELRKYVGIVFRAKTAKTRIESHVSDFKACITDCIRRYKNGAIRNLEGYLYASVRALSRRLYLCS